MACKAISVCILGASQYGLTDVAAEDDSDHPNKMPFTGTLLLVDQPSTKPPHGSRGHRIFVATEVAKKTLDSLIGMGVNYDPGDLNEHMPRHKVGIITDAWLDGNRVRVKGWIYKKDFPEAAKDLKQGGLGMSMELANVYVRDENEDVWYLSNFQFTGATILKKEAAAYYGTSLAASMSKLELRMRAEIIAGARRAIRGAGVRVKTKFIRKVSQT